MVLLRTASIFVFVLLVSTTCSVQAQRVLSSRVTDVTGAAVSEANVRVEGASTGTATDDKGRFSLPIKDAETGSNLLVSHLGYQTQTMAVAQMGTEIQLSEQVYQIGEVAVKYVDLRRLLIRKWRIDEQSIDKVAERTLENIKKKDPAKYERLAKRPDSMKEGVKLIRLVFHEDGTAKIKALILLGKSFNWQFDEDNRTIAIIDKEGEERKQVISELTASHLVLKTSGKDGSPIEIGYVPAN